MLGDYTLYPFMHLPNCQLHEQGVDGITCVDTYKKIIALRVYFAITILNFIFIVFTTLYFVYRLLSANWSIPPSDILSATNQNISKQWRVYSLKKRDIFGSVLGAIGHLIFSTTVLLYQVFVNKFSCDIFLWGPVVGFFIWTYALLWRAYRLHLLIRVNELQQRYHVRNAASYNSRGEKINDESTAASINKNDKDYSWFMRHKDALNVSTRHHILVCSFFLIIIICIITLAESLAIWSDGYSRCEIYMGNYMVSAFVAFFFFVIVPSIFWFLRTDEDAHGVRKEIWVTVAVGIPCSILCIIWQIVFDYPTSKHPAGVRGVFGPCNWLIILTTTNHVVSTIFPVFKTLTIDKNNKSACRQLNKKYKRSWIKRSYIFQKLFCPKNQQRMQSTTTLGHSTAISGHRWELTIEYLYHALSDPEQLTILKTWAVKDFSVENILFYDRYLNLVKQLNQSRSVLNNTDKLVLPAEPNGNQLQNIIYSRQSDTLSKPNEELLSIPFNSDQIPQLVNIYNTFIVDQAPLQVNISYKARSVIDKIMGPLSKQYRNNLSVPGPSTQSDIPYFLQFTEPYDAFNHPSITSKTKSSEALTISTTITDLVIIQEKEKSELTTTDNETIAGDSVTTPSSLTLQVFEQARKEVFWNIFSGLFPKVVEAYSIHSHE